MLTRGRPGRRVPVGAEPCGAEGVHFRVWAPAARSVEVVLDDNRACSLDGEPGGYFSGVHPDACVGSRYCYRLDGDKRRPDPASRFQSDGPHGPSEVIDPAAFAWHDDTWQGIERHGAVLYELHVGTFTREGTWAAAARELEDLVRVGVTAVEIMPVAEFPGRFGWGYDGVDLFAPTRLYGRPDDMRAFVDRAHALGLGVLLDVVYNHLGPDGNYLGCYAPQYFTDRYACEWGDCINFDGDDAAPVRELLIGNAGYWIDEFHLDGLRLDATQAIHDASRRHIIAAVAARVRQAAGSRRTLVIAESEPQQAHLVRERGVDALWNDDFHHAARVAATGRREAYFVDYRGTPQELISCLRWGWLYQGQHYRWQHTGRGSPARDLDPGAFVTYLQNHDQVANYGRGERLHQLAAPGRVRALTALQLLGPGTPLLFQGQEFAASSPFTYFADHVPSLADQVAHGRRRFMAQFPSLATREAQAAIPDPHDEATFRRCKLDPAERQRHAGWTALHRDLLRLRREDPVFAAQSRPEGAVLSPSALALRWFGSDGDDRLLLVNLGAQLALSPLPEPLLACPAGRQWALRWSSEQPRYDAFGTPPWLVDGELRLPPDCALLLAAEAI